MAEKKPQQHLDEEQVDAYARWMYLVSSDTDLLPAIQKAQEKGKKVVYVGFSHKLSHALMSPVRKPERSQKILCCHL